MVNFIVQHKSLIIVFLILLIFAIHKGYIVLSLQFYLNHAKIKFNELKIKRNHWKQKRMIKRFKKISFISPMSLTEMYKIDEFQFKITKLLEDKILLERLYKNNSSDFPDPNLEAWVKKEDVPANLQSIGTIFEVFYLNSSNNLNFKAISIS